MYKLAIDINVLLDEKSEIVNIDKKVGSILISHLNKNKCMALAVINCSAIKDNLTVEGHKIKIEKLV